MLAHTMARRLKSSSSSTLKQHHEYVAGRSTHSLTIMTSEPSNLFQPVPFRHLLRTATSCSTNLVFYRVGERA